MLTKIAIYSALLMLLAGCAGGLDRPALSQRVADKIIDVDTPEQRLLRAAGFAVIACELAADRVRRTDAEAAPTAWVFCQTLVNAIAAIRSADGLWTNADLFDAKRIVILAAGEQGKKRATSLLTSLGFGGAIKLLAKGAKAVAMLRDVSYIVEAVQSKKLTLDAAWKGIDDRMQRNLGRLEPLVDVRMP